MRKGYLGVDIGSISTKAVIIDKDNNILLSKYIWTEGNPIEAVKKINNELILIDIAKNDSDWYIRLEAVKKIYNKCFPNLKKMI